MRKGILYLTVFLLLLAAPTGYRYLRYYNLTGEKPVAPPQYSPEKVVDVPTPAAASFIDEPEVGRGFVLLDETHRNSFSLDEIGYLDGRLAARGVELLHYTGGDLATALRSVSAFIVISPLINFSQEEILAVTRFIERGGRLLLIGDPTRFNVIFEEDLFSFSYTLETNRIPLNSLANEFGIIFQGDYLYNTVENEGNFRNIILKKTGFTSSPLTEGLEKLAFYGSNSLQVGAGATALLTTDNNTWSSSTDRPGELALAATSANGRVLAIGDIHFLTEPYHTVFDNSRFIAQIADFLAETSARDFILADFPFFFNGLVDLVYTGSPDLGPDAFDEIIALQDAFRRVNQVLSLTAVPQPDRDTLYLGLYSQSEDVVELLASAAITLTIDPPIVATRADNGESENTDEPEEESDAAASVRLIESDLGKVQMPGTSLILLDENDGRRSVVVLAASKVGLENTIDRLLNLIPLNASYALADCLLMERLALCPTNVATEAVEAELDTSGTPSSTPGDEDTDAGGGVPSDLNAVPQGIVKLDEPVEGALAESESHAWVFKEGPAVIDILVESDEDLDAVLELYGPDNELISSADSTYTGGNEQLLAIDIPDNDNYTIVVRDYFDNGGSYTLTVTLADETGQSGEGGIFIFVDDDGVPLNNGITSREALITLLGENYNLTTWISSEDGPLPSDVLQAYELVIWDSGDYRNEAGFLDDDTAVILDYLDNGGDIFITGSSPALFGNTDLASLVDLEVAGDDPVLLRDLTVGDIVELDQVYQTVLTDLLGSIEEDSVGFFLRGPASQDSGNVVGVTFIEQDERQQKSAILLVPFVALPADIQTILLRNLMAWFGLSPA